MPEFWAGERLSQGNQTLFSPCPSIYHQGAIYYTDSSVSFVGGLAIKYLGKGVSNTIRLRDFISL